MKLYRLWLRFCDKWLSLVIFIKSAVYDILGGQIAFHFAQQLWEIEESEKLEA